MWVKTIKSDAEVVRLTLDGDRRAFETLVERYTRLAYAVAFTQLGNRDDAQDAVQEAWVQAFTSLDRLREPGQFRPWFAAIVRNISINAAKKKWRERPLEEAHDWGMYDTRTQIEQSDLQQTLWAQIAALSPDHREVLGLFYYAGMTTEEIAAMSGEPREVIKKRLQRARAALDHQMLRNLYEPAERDEERLRKRVMALLLILPVHWESDMGRKLPVNLKRTTTGTSESNRVATALRWLMAAAGLIVIAIVAGRLFLWFAAEPATPSPNVPALAPLATPAPPVLPAQQAPSKGAIGKGGKGGM